MSYFKGHLSWTFCNIATIIAWQSLKKFRFFWLANSAFTKAFVAVGSLISSHERRLSKLHKSIFISLNLVLVSVSILGYTITFIDLRAILLRASSKKGTIGLSVCVSSKNPLK